MENNAVIDEFLEVERYYRAALERAKMDFRNKHNHKTEERLQECFKDYLNLLITVWERGECPSKYTVRIRETTPECDSFHEYADWNKSVTLVNDPEDVIVMSGVVRDGFLRRLDPFNAMVLTDLLETSSDILFDFERRHGINVDYL